MTPTTYRWMFLAWPLVCGLIVGGLLGAITGSLSLFALVGTFVTAVFYVGLRDRGVYRMPDKTTDLAYDYLPQNVHFHQFLDDTTSKH